MTQEHAEHATPLTWLAEDEVIFRDSVRQFADAQVRPLVREMDEQATMSRPLIDQLFQLGVMGIEIPEAYGGSGGRFFHSVLAVEELSRVDPSVGVLVDVQNTLVINALLRWGTEDVRRRYLPTLASTMVGAYALSEAGSGSDAFALTTRAREDGDHFVLNGRKLWITNANEADLFIVFATVNPDAGYRGITAFLVERGAPGFAVGKKEDKLGIRASSTCELVFDEIPRAKNRTCSGDVGKGYKTAIETLNEGRIGIGAQMVGLAQRGRWSTPSSKPRRSGSGSARPIGGVQAVQHQLARRGSRRWSMRGLTVCNARVSRDAGRPFLTEAAICKILSSEVAERVASLAVNVFGGASEGLPVSCSDAKIGQSTRHIRACTAAIPKLLG